MLRRTVSKAELSPSPVRHSQSTTWVMYAATQTRRRSRVQHFNCLCRLNPFGRPSDNVLTARLCWIPVFLTVASAVNRPTCQEASQPTQSTSLPPKSAMQASIFVRMSAASCVASLTCQSSPPSLSSAMRCGAVLPTANNEGSQSLEQSKRQTGREQS
ncbi:hypothetical protein HDK77DRAFT_33080 [Phyllosticta capitalensis]